MFEASEALHNVEGMKKIKTMLFHWYSWNSEVKVFWISLIGWPQKKSSTYVWVLYVRLDVVYYGLPACYLMNSIKIALSNLIK